MFCDLQVRLATNKKTTQNAPRDMFCDTPSSGLMRLTIYNSDQLLAKNAHQNAASHTRERAAIHTSDTETRPKIRLETEKEGISRNVTDNDKLFWRRQSSSAVSITSIYEVMKKCWKVQGWSSNIQPKSEKNKAFNQKKSLGCVVTHQIHQKLMLTKSMVPLGFPLIFSGRIPTCGSPGSHGDSKNKVNEPWIQVFDRKWRHVVEILMKLDIAMIFRWSTSAPAFHICKEPPLATPISSKCAFLPRKCCKCLW